MSNSQKLFYLILLGGTFISCAGTKPVKISEACIQENFQRVEIEGYLRFPSISENSRLLENLANYLLLVEKANGSGGFLYTLIKAAESGAPNQMIMLPQSYTYQDFHVFTNQGQEISADDRVKVTGQIIKEKNSCILKIDKIEQP